MGLQGILRSAMRRSTFREPFICYFRPARWAHCWLHSAISLSSPHGKRSMRGQRARKLCCKSSNCRRYSFSLTVLFERDATKRGWMACFGQSGPRITLRMPGSAGTPIAHVLALDHIHHGQRHHKERAQCTFHECDCMKIKDNVENEAMWR